MKEEEGGWISLTVIEKTDSIMKLLHPIKRILSTLWLLFQVTPAVAHSLIDEIEGVYVIYGKATYQRCPDCAWEPVKNATDCLVIQKKTTRQAYVYMSTIQARGHGCYVEDVFTIRDRNTLFFHSEDMKNVTEFDGIYVTRAQNKIKLKAQPSRLEREYLVCGDSAGLEEVVFPLSSRKKSWDKRAPPVSDPSGLEKYCPKWGG